MTTEHKPERVRCGLTAYTGTIQHWIEEDDALYNDVRQAMDRFFSGDWGELGAEDAELNTLTLEEDEGRLMGVYRLSNGERIYIITSGYGDQELGPDYCNTVVMAPSDY